MALVMGNEKRLRCSRFNALQCKVICPSGWVCEFLSRPREKNILLPVFRNLCFAVRIPSSLRGALRGRHERWDGMRWTRAASARSIGRASEPREPIPKRARRRRCRGRLKRVVLAPVAGVKSAEACRPNRAQICHQFAGDRGKTNSSPRRARHKLLKPSACGNAGCFRCLRCEYLCAYLTPIAHTGLRVHWAPGIPHALCFQEGEGFWKTLGRTAPRSANACLNLWRHCEPGRWGNGPPARPPSKPRLLRRY
jgi:hypothetical protein